VRGFAKLNNLSNDGMVGDPYGILIIYKKQKKQKNIVNVTEFINRRRGFLVSWRSKVFGPCGFPG
jgi:hypothetical protein